MKKNFSSNCSRQSRSTEGVPQLGLKTSAGGASCGSQRGVALVITLIMLSVTLVMAVAFLAISRRDRASVSSTTDITTARLAADSALARAQAQIIANLAINTNLNGYSLLVSTNYINPGGFLNGFTIASPNNVNYTNAMKLGPDMLAQNIANLQILPRAPVLMSTNEPFGRFYLDLNRNGAFEANGYQPQVAANGNYYHTDGTISSDLTGVVSNFMTGDPEWIGILARPDAPHSPQNQFIARYAFLAQPIGNTLDFNYIHNQALDTTPLANTPMDVGNDFYYRNQGVGSWEINLAAFFADLDTNAWDAPPNEYEYNRPFYHRANTGFAFVDAFSILNYRYADYYLSLTNASGLYVNQRFANDNIDEYSDGPLQTNLANIVESFQPDAVRNPWVGADNTNRLFSLDDIFKVNETAALASRLIAVSQNKSTYDRYTYYRMLDQIGMDSAPEPGKLNLNYDNVSLATNTINGVKAVSPPSGTNFLAWTPVGMFTNVAERLLRSYTKVWYQADPSNFLATYYGYHTNNPNWSLQLDGAGLTNFPYFGMTNQIPTFGITNIPVVYHSNFVYATAINRLLQLAANIVDATSNNFYPSVFKPLFYRQSATNLVICGYQSIVSYNVNDINTIEDWHNLLVNTNNAHPPNIWGVPWIIGAKKGFPNFNEFSLENSIDVTRRLMFRKSSAHQLESTNQSFIFTLNTQLGVELWNSYTNAYPTANLDYYVYDGLDITFKNSNNVVLAHGGTTNFAFYPVPSTVLRGTTNGANGFKPGSFAVNPPNPSSFFVPLYISTNIFPPMAYTFPPEEGFYNANSGLSWNSSPPQVLPAIYLQTTNRLRVFLVDNTHIIDYVQFVGPLESTNIVATFQSSNALFFPPSNIVGPNSDMWSVSLTKQGVPTGVANQIAVSMAATPRTGWSAANETAADKFAVFMSGDVGSAPYPVYNTDPTLLAELEKDASNLVAQAPYNPTVTIRDYTSWQANDPLVHYLASDLPFIGTEPNGLQSGVHVATKDDTNILALANIGALNDRYGPWGRPSSVGDGNPTGIGARNSLNAAVQDPLVWSSDSWAFPTNRFPSVGWLGRVHRGTPWQTVYLKSRDVLTQSTYGLNTWAKWTSDYNAFDAIAMVPRQDRMLFDLFTAAPNDNATRGLLSVNQTHLAAWSAIFGGVVALTNANLNNSVEPGTIINYGWTNINPAGINAANSPLGRIVNGINATRANTNIFPNGTFQHLGDILATPALTDQSPFFNTNPITGGSPYLTNEITDAAYEWLPEQTLSLLKLDDTPRYVIYCYGQTLKPMQGAQVTSGANFGLTTNYQVVAESAAKAVVQVRANITILNGKSTTNYTTTVESYNVLPPDYISP